VGCDRNRREVHSKKGRQEARIGNSMRLKKNYYPWGRGRQTWFLALTEREEGFEKKSGSGGGMPTEKGKTQEKSHATWEGGGRRKREMGLGHKSICQTRSETGQIGVLERGKQSPLFGALKQGGPSAVRPSKRAARRNPGETGGKKKGKRMQFKSMTAKGERPGGVKNKGRN